MAVTRLYPAVTLLLAGTYLLLVTSNLCEPQNNSIDFGLNLTLAFKRPIRAGLEAVNRRRHELAHSTIFNSTARNPSAIAAFTALAEWKHRAEPGTSNISNLVVNALHP